MLKYFAASVICLTLLLNVFFAQTSFAAVSVSVGGGGSFFGLSIGGGGSTGGSGGSVSSTVSGYGLPSGSIGGIIFNILDWILAIVGAIGIIGFAISGIMYILAAGDDKMAEKAKGAMKNSIIGVIVALSGFVILQAMEAMLSENFF